MFPSPVLDNELVEAVKVGGCILFLGAGVHYPPADDDPEYGGSYAVSERPPLSSALARILADDSPLADDPDLQPEDKKAIATNLQKISLYYEMKKGRAKLAAKVKEVVATNKRPSRVVKALAKLDFRIICTTNYDNLFEMALFLANKTPIVSSYSTHRYAITKDYYDDITPPPHNPFLFKIHGDIDDPSHSIVITEEDYIHFAFRMMTGGGQNDPFPRVFRSHVQVWPILFVGFSLIDYNLRVFFKSLGWHEKDAISSYSVGPSPDVFIRSKYGPPVKFITRDVWKFVPDLYLAVTGNPMP